jgi:hypothetical protein
MNTIENISLNINSTRRIDFYSSLLYIKTHEQVDISIYKKFVDSIYLDTKALSDTLNLNTVEEGKINANVKELYSFIKEHEKDSPFYKEIAPGSLSDFAATLFIQSTLPLYTFISICKKWLFKEDSPEAKILPFALSMATENLSRENRGKLNSSLNILRLLNQDIPLDYLYITNENGNIDLLHEKDIKAEPIVIEIYFENNGKLRKYDINKLPTGNNDEIKSAYIKKGAELYKFDLLNEKEVQLSKYINYDEDTGVIDMKNALCESYCKIPKEELSKLTQEKDGNRFKLLIKEKPKNGDGKDIFLPEAFESLIEHLVISESSNEVNVSEKRANTEYQKAYQFIATFMKYRKSQQLSLLRNYIIFKILFILKECYPGHSSYVANVVTGYIVGQLGYMDTEERHKTSGRTQSYLKYLEDTVAKVRKTKKSSHYTPSFLITENPI